MILEILFWVGFAVVLGLAVWASIKYKVTLGQLGSVLDIMTLMKFVNKQFNYAQQDDLERVLEYCVEVIDFVTPYVKKGEYGHDELFNMIIQECTDLCEKEGITVSEELTEIIKLVAHYIATTWLN